MSAQVKVDALATRTKRAWHFDHGGITITLVVLAIATALVAPRTLGPISLNSMLILAGVLAIAAAGQTLVIQQRGFDLSVPATMVLSAVVYCSLAPRVSDFVAVLVVAALALLIGALNGAVITMLSITPIVATLAVNSLVLGVVWTVSAGLSVRAPDGLSQFARFSPLGVPVVAVLGVLVVAVLALFQGRTVAGRNFLAAGASPRTARAAALAPNRHVVAAYVVSACCASFAGVLISGVLSYATMNLGDPYLLLVVAAVVIGGTPLTGGGGSVVGTGLAALFVILLTQLTLALGAPTSSQFLVQSLAIVLAVGARSVPWSSLLSRRHRPQPAGIVE
ncbi:ABC transporter permease [Arthrobacter sp. P2b]|uniref:ABC transporter permease n=1 Tax=Arthrobacter sp. P2b TaxID=1938741 RepID=UPI0009A57A20|nr:ABC transporter permease [Arthrobacter sp. P2b]SLK16959.1 ribose transport system permease protein [Arthrobacter sp. P2b]